MAALLAALYARYSVLTAQKANRIAVHNEQLKIYEGYSRIQGMLMAMGADYSDKELWREYAHVNLSEFYFSKGLYEKFQSYFSMAGNISMKRSMWRTTEENSGLDARIALVKETHELHGQCLALGKELDAQFRHALRLS